MRMCRILSAAILCSSLAVPALADEGMWMPEQVPQVAKQMKKDGLKLNPRKLKNLTGYPLGAVVWLGNCTASFVSDRGLVVTNHHCGYGSIQYNSTAENNLIKNGFYAKTLADELPAAPGSRISVTTGIKDVTRKITKGLSDDMAPLERYQAIDQRRKDMVAKCEAKDEFTRCSVSSFYGGLKYYLMSRMTIRDVRLVYAPPDSIGKYGGDIDNWMWPRHTGDFSYLRAYVGRDGKPADYSPNNVPFKPKYTLKVQPKGIQDGDYVMAAGYPGRTSRYRRLSEVQYSFDWYYPRFRKLLNEWIKTIDEAAPKGTDARVKYESLLASLNNYEKNLGGQMEGARKVHLPERKEATEAALNVWIAADPKREAKYAADIIKLDEVIRQANADARKYYGYRFTGGRPALLSAAKRLYRLSIEQQKPNEERESGYQKRDMRTFKQSMERISRRYDPKVDEAVWRMFLQDYLNQPAENRVAALDTAMGIHDGNVPDLDPYYSNPVLGTTEARIAWMNKSPEDFRKSDDPFIKLAVALYDHDREHEKKGKRTAGELQALRPKYMEAIISYNKSLDKPVYADANSTLRITFGNVLGESPQDGLVYKPFTTLQGITAKDTGEEPFNAPKAELKLIANKDYGPYELKPINSVPVNFLANLDITGGNSGSPAMNAKGELVGLLFDGTYESINSDWDFDVCTTRTIAVDVRYMLWVMDKLDGADRLLKEMGIQPSDGK